MLKLGYWNLDWHILTVSLSGVDLLSGLLDGSENGVVVQSIISGDNLCCLFV
jgi:hypothetical protein